MTKKPNQGAAGGLAKLAAKPHTVIFQTMRTGIRIIGHRGHPEVKDALIKFAKWLRKNYEFPIRVPVYFRPECELTNMHGEKCSASFFAPWDNTVEPYIRIATGDYEDEKIEHGRDITRASFSIIGA